MKEPTNLILNRRRLSTTALTLSLFLFSCASPTVSVCFAATGDSSAAPQSNTIFTDLDHLIKEYYPKAKVTSTNSSMHFEFKAHDRENPYSSRTELSPDLGGIIGDLKILPGEAKEKDKLPAVRNEIVHSVLLMAPYSGPDNQHLYTRLLFQPDTAIDFMEQFKSIVNGFKKESVGAPAVAVSKPSDQSSTLLTASTTKPAVASASTKPADANAAVPSVPTKPADAAAATPSASTKPTDASPAPPPPITPSTTFGAAKLSKYSYPEGRFKVLLPGSPQMKYTMQAGMRMVDYAYPEAQGTFNISYVILPQEVNLASLNLLLDKMSASVVTSVNGTTSKNMPTTLQGFPGRQIEVPQIKEKPGHSARFKLFIVRKYVYVLGMVGKKAWLDSPIAQEFMSSFIVMPELTAFEEAKERQKEAEKRSKAFDEQFQKQRNEFDQKFAETQSRNRKSFEHSQAEFENNRYRH